MFCCFRWSSSGLD